MNVIKRHGKNEKFDERKLYASVYSAALIAGYDEKKAEKLAEEASRHIKKKIGTKNVTSNWIRKEVISMMRKHDKDVAFLYETHLDVS